MAGTRTSARLKKAAPNTAGATRNAPASLEKPRSSAGRITRSRAQQFQAEGSGRRARGLKSADTAATPAQSIESQPVEEHSQGSRRMSQPARRGAKAPSQQRSIASLPSQRGSQEEEYEEQNHSVILENEEEVVDVGFPVLGNSKDQDESPFAKPPLNPVLLVRQKDKLLSSAADLYDQLTSDRTESIWADLVKPYRDSLNSFKSPYTVDQAVFIDHNSVATSVEDFPEASDLSAIISAANLVTLLDTALNFSTDRYHCDIFKYLDENFPWCIMAPDSAKLASYDEHSTLSVAVKVRAIRWVLEIAVETTLNPDVAMGLGAELWLGHVSDPQPRLDALNFNQTQLKDIFDVEFPEQDGEDPQEQDDEIQQDRHLARAEFDKSIRTVCAHIRDGKVDLRGMQLEVNTFLESLASWAQGMFDEVRLTIDKEIGNPANVPKKTRRGYTVQQIEQRIAFEESLLENRASASQAGTASPRKRNREGDDYFQAYAESVGYTGDDYDEAKTSEDDEEQSASERVSSRQPKRRAKTTETHPARRGTTPLSSQSSWRSELPSRNRTATLRHLSPAAASSAPRLGDRERAVPRERQPSRQQSQRSKSPIPRRRFGPEDTNTIIWLVGKHGSGWSDMERTAKERKLFDPPRTHQQIRDKARNIKKDLLRRDKNLPPKFDKILLYGNDRQALIDLGKNPDRKEADVDRYSGRPIMTEYVD